MLKSPLFYPFKWIRSEWGEAMGIETVGQKNSKDALKRARILAENDQDFMENYSVATMDENGNYIPIPKGTSDQIKKELIH